MKYVKSAGVLAAAVCLCLAACSKKESGAPKEQPLGSDLGAQINKAGGEAAASTGVQAFSNQLAEQQSQLASLKSSAASLSDKGLNDLLGKIDGKLTQLSEKINELRTAEGGSAQAVTDQVKKLSLDAGQLLSQAKDWIAGKTGGG